ncbi:DNA (cytosine-5-)-methyltransferase [Eggerthellaceae bacterium zg-1084]|uniref:Cytosine-specific methyltransferase n=1 Tax=Berryella wangjianweii TaxID=2734634 RepID=A0A6M8J9K8_9ACTN|nr:DNA (cytosine-5-)-methyltransferase [Berryella wangjianweii]NPD31055.1 DNA (cytosine-5-)-methyltransferase [Berryella wangjianweii]NPD31917.1 DNA (cytosine-5-)-methyltransferase [Eggerthellaceae bacterium zg-997]QKF07492.1 DNA (cytosine-5-)-methyltransferase [Berryella wangjianweii]
MSQHSTIRVAEMFAGVGGFRLALDGYESLGHPLHSPAAGPFRTVWANQWEPPGTASKQFAWRCYEARFGQGSCVNRSISEVLDSCEAKTAAVPDFDLLVGGFPCQDYSVAKPRGAATGIEGKKGVLWWDILRMIAMKRPRAVLLENVDRLLKSPASQRGRDFAIILSCLAAEGYQAEWRVINAADYGMPQRRRRVFLYAERVDAPAVADDLLQRALSTGVLAASFPVQAASPAHRVSVSPDPYQVSQDFGKGAKVSPWLDAGAMRAGTAVTVKTTPCYDGPRAVLGDVLSPADEVPPAFLIDPSVRPRWVYLKGAKSEQRTSANGFSYRYTEGGVAFPDPLDRPARTILTSEGGVSASRTKHAVVDGAGRLRRLVPDELDQLQMFPKGWTDVGISDGQRAFCMGNALVVGIPHRIGRTIAQRWR